VLLWLPLAAIVSIRVTDPNQVTLWVMGGLLVEFLVWLWVWGRWVYGIGPIFPYYGLRWRPRNGLEALLGLCVGLVLIGLLYSLQGFLDWLEWAPPPRNLVALIGQGALVGLAVGLAEELLFRGWLLDELERDFSPARAAAGNAIAFALLHFLKPLAEIWRTLPQLAGLLLLGLVLVRAKQRTGQLGLPIGIHAGLVWGYYLVDVGDWVVYGDRIPSWLTGINENPLAGAIGLLFLLGVLGAINRVALRKAG